MDWKFWVPLAISVVALGLNYLQVELQRRAIAAASGRRSLKPKVSFARMYWPLLTMALLLIGAWAPYFWLPIYVQQEPILMGWGSQRAGQQATCGARVNGSRLQEFAESHRVVLMCGISSSRVDRVTDALITISPAFTIESRPIDIQMDLSQITKKGVASEFGRLLEGGRSIEIQVPMWYEAAIVPKNAEMAAVHSIADIERVGGSLFPGEGRGYIIPIVIP